MNSNLLFDFTVDKEKNTVNVKREFAADLSMVWDAWTKPELLDLWWAPKPYQTKTVSMDFREGGMWLYYMESPQGEKHYCLNHYKKIVPLKNFSGLDAFCDEKGNVNNEFPRTVWNNSFVETSSNITTVNIVAQYESLDDLEKIISMGFKEGFTMALDNLDQYIEAQVKLRKQNKTNNKARVCTYLNFDGKTEEAFLFYKSVFKTDFCGDGIQHFGDLPENSNHPPIPESIKKMVLHVELPTLGNHILMGTDAPKEMGFTLTQGNNMHISLEPESRAEADRLFNELSGGGKIDMPMQDMFFGSYFGSFTDKYGINWMVNFMEKK
jgi:PhnB protein